MKLVEEVRKETIKNSKKKELTEEQEEQLIYKEYNKICAKIKKAAKRGHRTISIWAMFHSEFIYDAFTMLESEGFTVYRSIFSTRFLIHW